MGSRSITSSTHLLKAGQKQYLSVGRENCQSSPAGSTLPLPCSTPRKILLEVTAGKVVTAGVNFFCRSLGCLTVIGLLRGRDTWSLLSMRAEERQAVSQAREAPLGSPRHCQCAGAGEVLGDHYVTLLFCNL